MYKRSLILIIIAFCMILFIACSTSESYEYEHDEASSDAGYRKTVLYYASEDGFLVPVMKKIPWEEGIGKAALSYLVDNDVNSKAASANGLNALIPEGTNISLNISKDGKAVVDLSNMKELASKEDENLMVSSIVNTLTEFPTINTVTITVDGKKVSALSNSTKLTGNMSSFAMNVEDGEVSASTDGASALTLYFPNRSGSLNVPVTRYTNNGISLENAMKELTYGPKNKALLTCFPSGTEVLSASVENGVATVDLSAEFLNNDYYDGLKEAAYETMYLTANSIEEIYELNVLVEGKEYNFEAANYPPMFANEFN